MKRLNSKMEKTEERIRQLKHKAIEITQSEQQREIKSKKKKKKEKKELNRARSSRPVAL